MSEFENSEVKSSDNTIKNAGANSSPSQGSQKVGWERDTLNRLAFAALDEQKKSRRWSIFFKSLMFIYLAVLLFMMPGEWKSPEVTKEHTALVQINGVIASDAEASADFIITGLRAAFENKKAKAIILRINSPGGSPVQAGYVYDEIKRLKKEHADKKVYAVITDMCASGGYYIAAGADQIYADKASLVGSIGVLINSFGFVDAMKKLGIERRMYTAGKNKGILDPFSPVKPTDRKHIDKMLKGIHQQFIKIVKDGRGDRLKQSPELFSGLFWNGDEAVTLGLVDALGSSSYVAREIVGAEKIVDYTPPVDFLERFAERLGLSFAQAVVQSLGNTAGKSFLGLN